MSVADDHRYQLRIARPAAHALTKTLPPKIAHAAYAFVNGRSSMTHAASESPSNRPWPLRFRRVAVITESST